MQPFADGAVLNRDFLRSVFQSMLRARILESGVKNLSQVYTQLKYTRESNREFSAELLENLARQRFLGGR